VRERQRQRDRDRDRERELGTMSDFALHNLWKEYGPQYKAHLLSREQVRPRPPNFSAFFLRASLQRTGSPPPVSWESGFTVKGTPQRNGHRMHHTVSDTNS
jgi:hypothetical protein